MIKIGTTFSGVGAVEHALERINIEHQIIFACDNGGINLFSKNLIDTFKNIEEEINFLNEHIKNLKLENTSKYKQKLFDDLSSIKKNYESIKFTANSLEIKTNLENEIKEILEKYKDNLYNKFEEFYHFNLDFSDYLFLVTEIKKILKDDKKIFKKLDDISKNKEYRLIRREIKSITTKLLQFMKQF